MSTRIARFARLGSVSSFAIAGGTIALLVVAKVVCDAYIATIPNWLIAIPPVVGASALGRRSRRYDLAFAAFAVMWVAAVIVAYVTFPYLFVGGLLSLMFFHGVGLIVYLGLMSGLAMLIVGFISESVRVVHRWLGTRPPLPRAVIV